MQVHVKLYGLLGRRVPGYDHRTGLALEVADGATVTDLLEQLALPLKKIGVVSLDGRLATRTTVLTPGVRVKVYHPIFGG